MNGAFENRFAKLKSTLDDPRAEFWGEGMVDDLTALIPLAETPSQQARLFRELAIVEAKRDTFYKRDDGTREVPALDHATQAMAAQAQDPVLDDHALYMMHMACGDIGSAWDNGPRTYQHLKAALDLHARLGRPLDESLGLQKALGIHGGAAGRDRSGLDWLEPLLKLAEAHHGADSPQLSDLLRLMSEAYVMENQMPKAVLVRKRAVALVPPAPSGPRVSAHVGLAKLLQKAGLEYDARQAFAEAIRIADASPSTSDQSWARKALADAYPQTGRQ